MIEDLQLKPYLKGVSGSNDILNATSIVELTKSIAHFDTNDPLDLQLSFSAIGYDSMMLMQLSTQLFSEFGIEKTVWDLVAAASIEEIITVCLETDIKS